MVEKVNAKRWINALLMLSDYPLAVLKHELLEILRQEEIERKEQKESPYYYIEAVRRTLELKKHEEFKNMPVADSLKQIMKGMFQ